MVTELMGHDVFLRQLAIAGTELVDQDVEEGGVEVCGLVDRAVERADIGRRRAAAGLHLVAEEADASAACIP